MGTKAILRALPRLAAGAMLILALATCGKPGGRDAEVVRGKADGPALEKRQADARRQSLLSDQFAFMRYEIDVSKDQPRACLVFSSTLNPGRDYTPYIAVEPKTQIALSVEDDKLCIGGLSFGQPRDVTIRAGLPDNRGRQLDFEETLTVEFGDRPSYVGFKGDGVILPRVEADGLGIETVNVDTVKVAVSRVTDRSLVFKSITQGFSASAGTYGYMDWNSDPSDLLEPVWTGEMDTRGSPNTAKTTVFPIAETIKKLNAGAYFIELEQLTAAKKSVDNGAKAKRWLIITDLALTTYTGTDGLSATVRSIQSAKPQRGVKLELIARNNEILARGTSNGDGHVKFTGSVMNGEGPMQPRLLMAYAPNGDYAVLDFDRSPLDLTEHDITGRSPSAAQADAFVYTERGVYRPGETVFANAIFRDAAANAVTDRAGSLIVYAPNGIEAARKRFDRARDAMGAVRYDFALPKTAARGQWRMEASIDGVGVVGEESFAVEDFVPQRIKLTLNVDDKTPMRGGERRNIESDVRFLYGAAGAGLPVEGSVRVEADPNPFPTLKDFRIGRHDEEFRETAFDLPAAVADGAGKATLILDPALGQVQSSRPMRLHAVVSAIEPGGRAVRDDKRVPYRPNDRYLGVKPAFDDSAKEGEPAKFEIIALDRLGALKSAEVNWRLIRIDWKYDWYRQDGGAWQWRQSREIVPIQEGNLRMADGQRGTITTRKLDWGDYQLLLTEANTGAEASMGFWSGWGGTPQDGVEAPDRVRLTVANALPPIGKDIEIAINPPYEGEAEIVVANENVIATKTLRVKAGGERIKLPVTKEWGSGVYIMASVYTPRDAVKTPKPRRAVGVAHVAVDVSPRTFKLEMKAPAVQRPRTKLNLELTATTGPKNEETYVTVAAVDEGILLLTGFKSPNPAEYFFAKRRLGVDLRDDYGRLLDPNLGVAAAVRTGGDQIGGAGLNVVPTKSVALFSGPVRLQGGKATVPIDIPDFNGELRLMAVAWSNTGLGAASQPLTVRDTVPAEIILPRFLAPGDEAIATVTLDNVEGGAGAYGVKLTTQGPVTTPNGTLSATLAAKQRQDVPATFRTSSEGISTLGLGVTGPNGFAVNRSYQIQARSPWLPASDVDRRVLQPGEAYRPANTAFANFTQGSAGMQVSVSPIPMDAAALFDSLDRYPYGCTEQIVSRAMPLLYASNMAALANRKAPTDIRNQVQEAISTLLNRQGADGAIGLWRIGDREATPWLGAYATDFLARAKRAGYVVPDAALDKAYDALEEFAIRENQWSVGYNFDVYESKWNPDTKQKLMDRSTAYAAYVLAGAGRMDRSRLRYLHDDRLDRIEGPLAKAQIAAALYMIGDQSRSKSAFDKAEAVINYKNDGDYYQTPRRDIAGLLALAGEVKSADRVRRMSQRVAENLPEPDRLTTQEKAFMLLAANALTDGNTAVTVNVAGAADVVTAGRVWKVTERQIASPPSFTNGGRSPLWVTAIARGTPSSAPAPINQGVLVDKQLYGTDDSRPGDAFAQRDRIIISVTVQSTEERVTPLVIADLLPAGFEIEAILRPEDGSPTGAYSFLGKLDAAKISEARDDRFVAAIDLYDRDPKRVAYIARAVTPGSFAMPGAVVEDMYRPDVFARSSSKRITVARR